MQHLKDLPRRFKNGFREGTASQPGDSLTTRVGTQARAVKQE